jgi:hypothetical protein
MSSPPFESLRERLLRAGVAPRHVRRYLRELSEHHADAVRAELAKGASLAAARAAAWARLGTEESLAQCMLERPELRSRAARFPALFLGVAPVLTWIAAPFGVAAVLSLSLRLLPEAIRHAEPSPGFIYILYALCVLHERLLPVVLGATTLAAAAQRRLGARWPLAGALAINLLAGTLTVYSSPGQLGINSSLLPWLLPFSTAGGPKDLLALEQGLLRAACMLALSFVVHRVAQRFGIGDRPTRAAE